MLDFSFLRTQSPAIIATLSPRSTTPKAMVSDLYDFQGHFLDRDGLRLHFLDEGTGPPVVMLHGNPTWSYYYRNLVRALRGSSRCIVPDHIGCGRSDKPDDVRYSYTLANRVEDVATLLDRLGVTKDISLILHDWGGMIGMAYAAQNPERIRRLVILNTAAFHLPITKTLPWPLWLCRQPLVGPLLVRRLNMFCRRAAAIGCTRQPLSPLARQMYLAPYNSWAHRIAVLRFVQDIPLRPGDPSYDLVTQTQDNLHKLRGLPMLICWGERDFVFDRHFLSEWSARFPDAQIHRFPDAGHYVLEDAAAAIVPLVRDFLGTPGFSGQIGEGR
jgi:cis-3-alkyl-4-acyloxetan-2-one decarboxylase